MNKYSDMLENLFLEDPRLSDSDKVNIAELAMSAAVIKAHERSKELDILTNQYDIDFSVLSLKSFIDESLYQTHKMISAQEPADFHMLISSQLEKIYNSVTKVYPEPDTSTFDGARGAINDGRASARSVIANTINDEIGVIKKLDPNYPLSRTYVFADAMAALDDLALEENPSPNDLGQAIGRLFIYDTMVRSTYGINYSDNEQMQLEAQLSDKFKFEVYRDGASVTITDPKTGASSTFPMSERMMAVSSIEDEPNPLPDRDEIARVAKEVYENSLFSKIEVQGAQRFAKPLEIITLEELLRGIEPNGYGLSDEPDEPDDDQLDTF